MLGGVEVDRLEALGATMGEEGFDEVIFGEWGRDERLECFIRGEALGVSEEVGHHWGLVGLTCVMRRRSR